MIQIYQLPLYQPTYAVMDNIYAWHNLYGYESSCGRIQVPDFDASTSNSIWLLFIFNYCIFSRS